MVYTLFKLQPILFMRLFVFDMAGTTVKDKQEVASCLQQALAAEGISVGIAQINPVMGYPKPVAISHLIALGNPDPSVNTPHFIDHIHQDFVKRMLAYYAESPDVGEKPGVREVVELLRRENIQVGIDTGFDRQIADTIFERLGWYKDQLFDYSVTSDEVAKGRPHPDMIFKIMDMAGIADPKLVGKVGDTPSDLQQGFAAGCSLVIGVTTGSHTAEELKRERHTHLIEDLREIADILQLKF